MPEPLRPWPASVAVQLYESGFTTSPLSSFAPITVTVKRFPAFGTSGFGDTRIDANEIDVEDWGNDQAPLSGAMSTSLPRTAPMPKLNDCVPRSQLQNAIATAPVVRPTT